MDDRPLVPLYRKVDPATLDLADPATFEALKAAVRAESRLVCMPQVRALLAARWRLELPGYEHDDSEPWQWAWRSPARRRGGAGRRYASTNQAYNALIRMTGKG